MSGAELPTSGRPQPAMNSDTRFFWEGAAQGRLLCQRCSGCGQLRHPPGPSCPACGCLDWEPVPLSGQGRIFSWVVQHHPLPPGFDEPAVIVLVDLAEGVRLVGNLAGGAAEKGVEIGAAVTVFFLPQDEGWTLPQFRLDELPE
jgi:uncharacterized OB-fold protein